MADVLGVELRVEEIPVQAYLAQHPARAVYVPSLLRYQFVERSEDEHTVDVN